MIERSNADPRYVNGIQTWFDVLNHIRYKLDLLTIKVTIYKWSKDNKCLGEKCVTMSNMWDVTNSKDDKILR